MKISLVLFLFFVFLVSMGSASQAAYKMGQKKPVRLERRASYSDSKKPSGERAAVVDEEAILTDLARQYGVQKDQLLYFRQLRHGYEEIIPALIVARESQVEVGRILDHRVNGQMWKDIAQRYDVDLKPLNKEVLDVLTPLRKILSKQALVERPHVRKGP